MPEIGVIEFGIMAALGNQILVASLFDNMTFLQDNNAIGRANSRKSVSNDDGRAMCQD